MSVFRRLISGSIASWMQILVTIFIQIVLVPLYLSYWSSSVYGLWLATTTFVGMLQIIDNGHQQYLGFEFLKVHGENTDRLSLILSASLPFAFVTGSLQIGFAMAMIQLETVHWAFETDLSLSKTTLDEVNLVVLLSVIMFGVLGSVGGILVRVLAPLGFYARMAWWGVVAAIVTAIAPAIAVIHGGGLLQAGIALVGSIILFNFFLYFDMIRLLQKAGVRLQKPDFRLGARNLWRSQALVLTQLLGMLRTTGVRLALAPLAGSTNLAAFATMRTGANIAHQGLGTITGPLMPDLMRVLTQGDQERTDAAFASIWLILVAIMAPAVVILQVFIEPLFVLWTRGQIDFNPFLFGILSLSILVFALAQPAMTVVTGNNLLRPQLVVAGVSAIIVVGGLIALVPRLGILGAGIAILGAELFAAALFRMVAKQWLLRHKLDWPVSMANSAAISIWIASIAIGGLVLVPEMTWFILASALILMGCNLIYYWRSIPRLAKNHARSIVEKIYFRKQLV